ncbi:hypothetical protein [Laspinema palackyanum]|uniref:hypothetical protein n=1 Tax=Laspinema palackyanum TaxID=3231601 RepID=UPI00345D860D
MGLGSDQEAESPKCQERVPLLRSPAIKRPQPHQNCDRGQSQSQTDEMPQIRSLTGKSQ